MDPTDLVSAEAMNDLSRTRIAFVVISSANLFDCHSSLFMSYVDGCSFHYHDAYLLDA